MQSSYYLLFRKCDKMGGRGASGGVLSAATAMFHKTAKNVFKKEQSIAGNSTETAILFDINGNEILTESQNNTSSVHFTNAQLAKMKDGILTHNHPNDGPLSADDLKLMYSSDAKVIRAVGKTTFHEISKIDGAVQHSGIWDGYDKSINDWCKSTGDAIFKDLTDKHNRGAISFSEFEKAVNNLNLQSWQAGIDWLEKNAVNYGYNYKHGKR